MVNGAELHRVNATVHLGHHISTNDNDSLVSAAIGQFWRGFNMFMADFSQIHSHIKGALYRIQILCRRYTFWSYPAEITIADTPGKQKLKYGRVYSHHFQTTIAESIHTTPNSIQCPFKCPEVPNRKRHKAVDLPP